MAQFEGTVYSASLGMMTGIAVSLPAEGRERPDGLPVLYLLHGLGDNHSCWLRRTAVDRYAEEYGIAVVMPEVQRSFYCDMAHVPMSCRRYASACSGCRPSGRIPLSRAIQWAAMVR